MTVIEEILSEPIEGTLVATGLRIQTKEGAYHDVLTRQKFIFCVGAIRSALILELSSIGQ